MIEGVKEKKQETSEQLVQLANQAQHVQSYARRLYLDTERALNSMFPSLHVTVTGAVQSLWGVCC